MTERLDIPALEFYRGFVLSTLATSPAPKHFRCIELDGPWRFEHDPAVEARLARPAAGTWLLIAGHAIDVEDGRAGLGEIAVALGDALTRDETALFDALDRLSGRFVVVYSHAGSLRVLHDACGLRSVFYSAAAPPGAVEGELIVASHARLVQLATGAPPSRMKEGNIASGGKRVHFGFPGCETQYAGVYQLTPNTLLDLRARRVERYFPRASRRPVRLDEAVERVTAMMRTQVASLVKSNRPLVLSLTAGLDSRLTLAVARPYLASIDFVTHMRPEKPDQTVDVAVARDIAQRLGLQHRVLETADLAGRMEQFEEFDAVLAGNTHYRQAPNVAYMYALEYSGRDCLHIRSNLSEIGRAYYFKPGEIVWLADWVRVPWRSLRKLARMTLPFDARQMARLYRPALATDPLVRQAFAEFHRITQFDRRQGYNPFDLFYWEHRMGVWHSAVVAESDPAFESHVLFNARRILEPMMSLPLRQRRYATLFHRIIEQNLPELAELPINPPHWP